MGRRPPACCREQVAGEPPLLVAHPLAFGARIVHEAVGLPLVTLHLQPTGFVSEHETAVPHVWLRSIDRWPPLVKRLLVAAGDRLSDHALAPPVNDLRAEFGLPPVRNIVREWWHSPRRVIGLFPDWYAAVQPDWPSQTRLTGFPLYDAGDATPLPRELETWLDAGAPPAVFVAGTANRQAARFFQAGADACRRLGRRGLLLSRFTGQIPDPLPPGVRHAEYAPFGSLLPRAAAIVHHGGIGTAAQALRAGCPQLVMPMAFDQPDNAVRLERLGVGRYLRPSRFTGLAAARELDALLGSDDTARACRAVAGRFDRDRSGGADLRSDRGRRVSQKPKPALPWMRTPPAKSCATSTETGNPNLGGMKNTPAPAPSRKPARRRGASASYTAAVS